MRLKEKHPVSTRTSLRHASEDPADVTCVHTCRQADVLMIWRPPRQQACTCRRARTQTVHKVANPGVAQAGIITISPYAYPRMSAQKMIPYLCPVRMQ